MHIAAWLSASLLFTHLDHWLPRDATRRLSVVDLGSLDVDGNMRDAIEFSTFGGRNYTYLGVNSAPGPNVDLALNASHDPWTFLAQPVDVMICTQLQHETFFWQSFLQMCNSLAEGGFLLMILPLHADPSGHWRFHAGSSSALAAWARSNGIDLHVSFSEVVTSEGTFEDLVVVFQKIDPASATWTPFGGLSSDLTLNLAHLLQYAPTTRQVHTVTRHGQVLNTETERLSAAASSWLRSSIEPSAAREVVCVLLARQHLRPLHFLPAEALIQPPENGRRPHVPLEIMINTGYCHITLTYLVTMEDLLFEGKLLVKATAVYRRLGLTDPSALVAFIKGKKEACMEAFARDFGHSGPI